MSVPASVDENDPFWVVQLSSSDTAETTPFEFGGLRADYEDNVLPAGTEITEQSLAGVVGCESDVSVPLSLKAVLADDDRRHSEDGRCRQMSPAVVLKLRQVNGDGVMSGVGGDVWCAALLLSTWLLDNPEAIRGLNVLELGSGLGLCGIAAGYLAHSVTLTDYIDELLANLHHNIEANRTPKVVIASSGEPLSQRKGDEEPVGLGDAPSVPSAAAVSTPCHAPDGTRGQGVNQSWSDRIDQGLRRCTDAAGSSCCCGRESSMRTLLQPLSRVCVRKLDWTVFAGAGGLSSSEPSDGDWWDDRGPGAGPPEDGVTETPGGKNRAGSDALHCDVAVGSALIYSPHHACVADVLSHAFTSGGCRAAYIVQLSTRHGFDDFLRRLGSCGLCYNLQRMTAALPTPLLDELRRRISVTVVGGPVNGTDGRRDTDEQGLEGTVGFDEFVLCSVFVGPKAQPGGA